MGKPINWETIQMIYEYIKKNQPVHKYQMTKELFKNSNTKGVGFLTACTYAIPGLYEDDKSLLYIADGFELIKPEKYDKEA